MQDDDETMAKSKGSDTFERKTFRTSRLADFASVSELIKQTGHPPENWPLVIVKELVDNALDEAEKAGTAPEIEIDVTDNSDHRRRPWPGHRACRGQVAGRLCVPHVVPRRLCLPDARPARQRAAKHPPMGFALAPDHAEDAEVLIESREGPPDPLRRRPGAPDPGRQPRSRQTVKTGTRVTVRWPNSPRSTIAAVESRFLPLAEAYGWFNPHLNLNLSLILPADDEPMSWVATDPDWSKWRPSQPTSPHWYDPPCLNRLMAAEIAHAIDHRTACPSVRDFIGQFRGLSGTQTAAAICRGAGRRRAGDAGGFLPNENAALKLLTAMRERSRPVKPNDLGVIGADHLMERMLDDGCVSIVYRKPEIEHDGLPYMIEVAFGYRGDEYASNVVEGFNFTPAVGGSPFHLEGRLENAEVEPDDPVTVFVHLTSPRLNFLDRGKARVSLPDAVAAKLIEMVAAVTDKWTKQKRPRYATRRR